MLFSNKNREDLEKLEELYLPQNQVEQVRLQDKLGKQNFQENIKQVFEPVTDTIKNNFEKKTKTMMLTSKQNNKMIENLDEKLFEIMKDRGIIAAYLLSPSSKTSTRGENTSQFTLIKDYNSNRVNDLLKHTTIPATLYNNWLLFHDTANTIE